MDSKELKQEIETKLQIAITLAVFFPTLLSTFLDAAGMAKKQLSSINLTWSALVASFLMDYIFFSLTKKLKFPHWVYPLVNGLLLVSIIFFVFPTAMLATTPVDKPISSWVNYVALKISMYGLPVAPVIILALLVFAFVWGVIAASKAKRR